MFELELQVRDYECDMDHVVNHAVYLNYLEHARHTFLVGHGIKFGELSRRGISLVVTRIEADFKASLTSGDSLVVRTAFSRVGRIRFQFHQRIYRMPDQRLMLSAVVTGTALNARGRPEIPAELDGVPVSSQFLNFQWPSYCLGLPSVRTRQERRSRPMGCVPKGMDRVFMQHWPFFFLAGVIARPLHAETAPAVGNAAMHLALYQVSLELCVKSSAYRDLASQHMLEFSAISKTINHLENDMHDAPNGKLLYISYQFNARTYRNSIEFRRQIQGQAGGVCDYRKTSAIGLKLKPLEALIRRHTGMR